jgi:hypothetical protein
MKTEGSELFARLAVERGTTGERSKTTQDDQIMVVQVIAWCFPLDRRVVADC